MSLSPFLLESVRPLKLDPLQGGKIIIGVFHYNNAFKNLEEIASVLSEKVGKTTNKIQCITCIFKLKKGSLI